MEEALLELTAQHQRLIGAIALLRILSAAETAKLGRIGYADASWALWRYFSEISGGMEEALGRAALALKEIKRPL